MKPISLACILTISAVALGCGGAATEKTSDKAPPPAATPEPAAATPAPATEPAAATDAPAMGGVSATAELMALGTSGVTGTVTFTERDGKVWIEAKVSGLTPGDHGFHIHEFGDCSAPDGTSAGGHFNPTGVEHGAFDPATPHHAGDLGNLVADAGGSATLSASTDQFSLGTDAKSILGRGVIVHEKADDLKTQPTGDAGGRVACAVIKADSGETVPVTKPAAQ